MVWSTPMTAVTNQIFTASQFNSNVRDNLLETAVANATTAGSLFRVSGNNSITEAIPGYNEVLASESTTSTSYTNLTTVGPQVTVTTGVSALVFMRAEIGQSVSGAGAWIGLAISGATTQAAGTLYELGHGAETSGNFYTHFDIFRVTGLTPGSNTFTMQYKSLSSSSSCNAAYRAMLVIPL